MFSLNCDQNDFTALTCTAKVHAKSSLCNHRVKPVLARDRHPLYDLSCSEAAGAMKDDMIVNNSECASG